MEKSTVVIPEPKASFYYGYIIVALSFLALFASMGIRASFGTYTTPWEKTFSVDRLWISTVSFTSLFVYGISMMVAGRLVDRIGPRKVLSYSMVFLSICLIGSYFAEHIWQMMILYGVIGSIGFGFASYITVSVAIVRWFKKKKGLMISIVVVGMAAGPMIYTPLNIFLIDKIGWKLLFVLYGGVYALVFLPLYVLFYRDRPMAKESGPYEQHAPVLKKGETSIAPSILSIFRHPITWLLITANFICGFTDIGLIHSHLVPLGENREYSRTLIANAMILYGVFNILGTIVIGYITDVFSNKILLFILFGIRLVALFLLIFVDQPIGLFVFALLYGLTDIATITPFTMLVSNIFGINRMGSAVGLIGFFHQFGAATGSLIPGYLFSLSSNYGSTLWLCVVLLIVNSFIILMVNEKKEIEA
ncbi:MFS transporter [Peribacillus saganii]|uniref:MFS transporter n=1 Tax=Peribacillus saganii TaxID=2303992 RepID=A0A372LQK2_9BACI|nr:MFS transporter [Peribacillus saganii]RFU70481.1 MFS transporter [Peribacillus saganii]